MACKKIALIGAGLLAVLALGWPLSPALSQSSGMQFKDLPPEVRKHADGIRQRCRDLGGGRSDCITGCRASQLLISTVMGRET
jgi:hypothetical protein